MLAAPVSARKSRLQISDIIAFEYPKRRKQPNIHSSCSWINDILRSNCSDLLGFGMEVWRPRILK